MNKCIKLYPVNETMKSSVYIKPGRPILSLQVNLLKKRIG